MIDASPSLAIRRARDQIDALDERLAELLLERHALAARIISERILHGGYARDLERERRVHERVAEHATTDQERNYLVAVFGGVLAAAPVPQAPPA